MAAGEWSTTEHVVRYLDRADSYPRRSEGEAVLLEQVPREARRPRPGHGGRTSARAAPGDRPDALGVGLDVSEPMLGAARQRFAGDRHVELIEHDLAEPLPTLRRFNVVVSSFAWHRRHRACTWRSAVDQFGRNL